MNAVLQELRANVVLQELRANAVLQELRENARVILDVNEFFNKIIFMYRAFDFCISNTSDKQISTRDLNFY